MIQRIPRPKGLTLLAQHLKQQNKPDTNERLKKHIIQSYLLNNFTINNKQYTIDQVAAYLQVPTWYVLKQVQRLAGIFMDNVDTKGIEETARAVLGMALKNLLDDRHIALNQVVMLRTEQGEKYVPYLTGELNKAISNLMQSSKGILDLYRALPSSPVGNQPPNPLDQPQSSSQTLSITKALELLEDKGINNLLSNTAEKEALYIEHNLSQTPDISGLYSEAQPTTSAIVIATKLKHEERRDRGFKDEDE